MNLTLKKGLTLIASVLFGVSLASCTDTTPVASLIDYAHNGSCKMQLDYKGKDFFVDGVGEFELWMTIDGDTAHFTPIVTTTSSATVKARFYGVDTPESTGRVQEYGKQASNFTKEKLKNAAANGTIVLAGVSSAYGVPTTDANGRYLSCVWINETKKNASKDELVNLNLWIVQEGYSFVGGLDKMPEYEDVFNKAYWQAKENKLKIHSGEPDPYYNYGEYEETDIPDIMKAVYANLADPTVENPYNGAKVKLSGTVAGFANNTLFIQKLDADSQQYYGINVFCGMTKPSNKYLIPGTVIDLCGIAQDSEEFGFQITGAEGHFPMIESKAAENDVHILVKAAENTDPATALKVFEYNARDLDRVMSDKTCLGSPVKITSTVTVNYFNANQEGNKWTIGFEEVDFDIYLTTAYAGDPDNPNDTWTTEAQWKGKRLRIDSGIVSYHRTSSGRIRYQILISNQADLVWVK